MTNEEIKILKKLHKRGLVSYKIFFYNDIDQKIRSLVRSGMNKTNAVIKLSLDLRVSKQTIWTALRLMR